MYKNLKKKNSCPCPSCPPLGEGGACCLPQVWNNHKLGYCATTYFRDPKTCIWNSGIWCTPPPTAPPTTAPPSKNELSIGEIVAILVGTCAVLMIVLLIFLYHKKKKKKKT